MSHHELLGLHDARVIALGDPSRSWLLDRMATADGDPHLDGQACLRQFCSDQKQSTGEWGQE